MNIAKTLCLFLSPLFLLRPGFAYVEKDSAVLRVMDKAAGKAQTITIPVDTTKSYDGLKISVKNCKQTNPFDPENFFVFLEINTKNGERIFSGWMNRNEPGQNPLQDDVYDVWLEKCE